MRALRWLLLAPFRIVGWVLRELGAGLWQLVRPLALFALWTGAGVLAGYWLYARYGEGMLLPASALVVAGLAIGASRLRWRGQRH